MHISLAHRLLFLVHLHAFTHAAPSPAPPILAGPAPLSLLDIQPSNKSLEAINSTLKGDFTALPDPCDIRFRGSSTTLEVYNYGRTFTPRGSIEADRTIMAGIDDAQGHGDKLSRQISTETVLRYQNAGITLICFPRQQLTWKMWLQALEAIWAVVDERSLRVEFYFLILEEGVKGEVGYGSLALDS